MSGFAYAVLTPGTTRLHKTEMARVHPELRFAFATPGLTTWKADAPLPANFRLRSALAQSDGLSVGFAKDSSGVVALVESLAFRPGEKPHLVVSRAPHDERTSGPKDAASDEAEGSEAAFTSELVASELVASGLFATAPPEEGAPVVEVFDLGATKSGRFFVGRREARFFDPRSELDYRRAELPNGAPSRAYAKAFEGLGRFPRPPAPGELALELGAAPGGAVHRCLELDLDVVAVDPADFAPEVPAFAAERGRALTLLQKSALDLSRSELPKDVAWLLCDMNLAPQVVVPGIERVLGLLSGPPRGALVTLKLNDDRALAALPSLEARASRWGAKRLVLRQLPSHRTEVVMSLLF